MVAFDVRAQGQRNICVYVEDYVVRRWYMVGEGVSGKGQASTEEGIYALMLEVKASKSRLIHSE